MRLFRSVAAALSLVILISGCRPARCPEIAPLGALKPPPARPVASRYQQRIAPQSVTAVDIELFDAARKRRVPLRAYLPTSGTTLPVIVFSHGLGSSRNGYQYLGKAWAAQGAISLHVEHIDSAAGLSLYRLYRSAYDPEVWRNRPLDISFVLDMLERKDPALRAVWERADLTRIGAAGHSYGARTVLNSAGVLTSFRDGPKDYSHADPRIDALVVLSVPSLSSAPTPASYAPVQVPVLHMTGTKDESPAFHTVVCHRRVPFDWIAGPPQYFVDMEGGVHRSFAGEKEAAGDEIEHYHALIVEFTNAFWDATLHGDARAQEWLDRVALPRVSVERK